MNITGKRPSSLKVSWVLRLKALRSLTTALIASTLGVLIGHDSLAGVALVTLLAGVAVSMWWLADEASRCDSLTLRANACKDSKPTSTQSVMEATRILIPLPLGIATVYGISRLGHEITGVQPGIVLGSLSGLLLGLAFGRARLAANLNLWAEQEGVDVLYRCSGPLGAEGPLYTYRVEVPPAISLTDPEMR